MRSFHIFIQVVMVTLGTIGCDQGVDIVKPILPDSENHESETTEIPTMVGEMKVPEEPEYVPPTGITYYRDIDLTMPVTGSVELGTVLYIQVVFSEKVPIVIANDRKARPRIFLTTRSNFNNSRQTTRTIQYRMKAWGTDLQSGDAMPYQGAFLCKYIVETEDYGKNVLVHTDVSEGDELEATLFMTSWEGWGELNLPTPENEDDFVGVVSGLRLHPVGDVTLTIMTGPRFGEQAATDQFGHYTFRDVAEDELHLRVEKEYFEPKEVIVYRDRQTVLADGDRRNFPRRKKIPGWIKIGQRWPNEIRPILENTLVVNDLLFYTEPAPAKNTLGSYVPAFGIVKVNNKQLKHFDDPACALLTTLAHEIAHAHQHALLSVDGSITNGNLWLDTPEGKAFQVARQKDWEEFGKLEYDRPTSHYFKPREGAAELFAYYWILYPKKKHDHQKLEVVAPNRFKWAQEWYGKRY